MGSNNVLTEGAALDRAGLDNVGSLTFQNPTGLQGLLQG
jgi:hypothetical protein